MNAKGSNEINSAVTETSTLDSSAANPLTASLDLGPEVPIDKDAEWEKQFQAVKNIIDNSQEKEDVDMGAGLKTDSQSVPTLAELRSQDLKLARWIEEQRNETCNWEAGIETTMTAERIDKLNSVDFFLHFVSKWDQTWNSFYNRLKEHYDLHKNYNVGDPHLKGWLRRQRDEYQAYQKLTSLGLSVVGNNTVGNEPSLPIDTNANRDKVDSALATTEEVLDTYIVAPALDPLDGSLATTGRENPLEVPLVSTIAAAPIKTKLTRERIDKLELINFGEYMEKIKSKSYLQKLDTRIEELIAYKQVHGNTNIPKVYNQNKPLGRWVARIRGEYKQFKLGKKSTLTKEMVDQLNDIGFEWESTSKYSANFTWETRFKELCQYKAENNNTMVPKKYSKNQALGTWVRNQRCQYMAKVRGKPSPITDERIRKLESIGFAWTPFQRTSSKVSAEKGKGAKVSTTIAPKQTETNDISLPPPLNSPGNGDVVMEQSPTEENNNASAKSQNVFQI